MSVYRQATPPHAAQQYDVWVDTANANRMWVVNADYSVSTDPETEPYLDPAVATIVYGAKLPSVTLLTADVHPSIPVEVAMRLAERVAANLAYSEEGANDKKVANWNRLFTEAVKRASVNRNSLTNPSDMRPG